MYIFYYTQNIFFSFLFIHAFLLRLHNVYIFTFLSINDRDIPFFATKFGKDFKVKKIIDLVSIGKVYTWLLIATDPTRSHKKLVFLNKVDDGYMSNGHCPVETPSCINMDWFISAKKKLRTKCFFLLTLTRAVSNINCNSIDTIELNIIQNTLHFEQKCFVKLLIC